MQNCVQCYHFCHIYTSMYFTHSPPVTASREAHDGDEGKPVQILFTVDPSYLSKIVHLMNILIVLKIYLWLF